MSHPFPRRAFEPRFRAPMMALLAAILGIAPLTAQGSAPAPDPRWLPWIGCWVPSGATEDAAPSVAGVHRVCVMPARDSDGVDVVNIADGQIISRVRIDATGERRPVSREGCTGWESARWSAGAERVFVRSELTCSGSIARTSSGIIAIASPSDWVDVQVVAVGDQRSTRILRYRSVADTTALAREISASIRDRELARQAARLAAASSPTIEDVVEASREADPAVVEAWLLQRMPRFALDAGGLTRLADGRVPDSVIDLVVALATPERFSDRLSARGYTFIRIDAPRQLSVAVADPVPAPAEQYYDAPSTTIGIYGAGQDEEETGHRHYDGCGHHGHYGATYYGATYYNAYPLTPFGFFPYWPYRSYHHDRYSTGYGYYPYTPFDPYRPRPVRPAPSRGQTQVITLPQRRPVNAAPAPQPDPAPEPAGGRVVNGRGYTRPSGGDATDRAPLTPAAEPASPRQARSTSQPAPTRDPGSTAEPAPPRKATRSSTPAPAPRPATPSSTGSRGQAAAAPAKPSASGKASGSTQPETPARTAKRRPPPTV
jgi:hypothetical protein